MAAKKKAQQPRDPFRTPSGTWENRVRFASTGAPIAYRPMQLICTGDEMRERALELIRSVQPNLEATSFPISKDRYLCTASEPFDVEHVVLRLRQLGFRAEPDYVFFSHNVQGNPFSGNPFSGNPFSGNPFSGNPFSGNPFSGNGAGCGGGCGRLHGNPFSGNPFSGNPFSGNPFSGNGAGCGGGCGRLHGNPFSGNPFSGNPFSGNPFSGNPFSGNPFSGNPFSGNAQTGERPSTARPASKPEVSAPELPKERARGIVFDTGIAMVSQLPDILKLGPHQTADSRDRERADETGDGFLDPISGHGTFIAGIMAQLAPGQEVEMASVLTTLGDGSGSAIAKRLEEMIDAGEITDRTVINMSFGSYGDLELSVLADSIRRAQQHGAVIVASAGNDGSCLPSYPAALPGVIGVASIEEHGPAPYTNFGSWVRACAPGTGVISSFFRSFNGDLAPGPEGDIDNFKQWARWTGTSFAAPIVAAALMRHIALHDSTAKEAVEAVIDGNGLLRLPGLGTVINLAPGM